MLLIQVYKNDGKVKFKIKFLNQIIYFEDIFESKMSFAINLHSLSDVESSYYLRIKNINAARKKTIL